MPFVHFHKKNDEIYVVLSEKGKAAIDDATVKLSADDWVRISPATKRQFSAGEAPALSFAYIQVK